MELKRVETLKGKRALFTMTSSLKTAFPAEIDLARFQSDGLDWNYEIYYMHFTNFFFRPCIL